MRLIEGIIKKIRAKQSYGIPVGGTASRLIAEAILSDFDHSMEAEEYHFSRFVDDIRIYVKNGESPYRALSLVAETLLSEGLTLNAQKTKVLNKEAYIKLLEAEGDDTFESSEKEALDALADLIYFEEEDDGVAP
ncbi:RNA-directed DNA polymerase [Neorhizobium sp. LMR1-1-1.1]